MTGLAGWLPALAAVSALALLVSIILGLAQRYLPADQHQLIDAIDELLPQTQCAQCGYPGCRPYAEAVAAGENTNLCPPGGPVTQAALQALLGEQPDKPLPSPVPLLAVIDESRCIGCALCIPPCPVDAIVGANKYMHTVMAHHCTGCELCVAPCPVDCIEMIELAEPTIGGVHAHG